MLSGWQVGGRPKGPARGPSTMGSRPLSSLRARLLLLVLLAVLPLYLLWGYSALRLRDRERQAADFRHSSAGATGSPGIRRSRPGRSAAPAVAGCEQRGRPASTAKLAAKSSLAYTPPSPSTQTSEPSLLTGCFTAAPYPSPRRWTLRTAITSRRRSSSGDFSVGRVSDRPGDRHGRRSISDTRFWMRAGRSGGGRLRCLGSGLG